MLTIKHIIWNGGFETLYEAQQVRAKSHEPENSSGGIRELDFIAFDDRQGNVQTISDGLVYVMNDTGKTIAKYDFRAAPKPLTVTSSMKLEFPTPPGGAVWTNGTNTGLATAENQRLLDP